LSRQGFVAMSLLEDSENGHTLHFRQSRGGKRSAVLGCAGERSGLVRANGRGKVDDVDGATVAQGDGARDAVLELADIAGPVILQEAFHSGGRDLEIVVASVAVQEVMNEHGNIGAAVT